MNRVDKRALRQQLRQQARAAKARLAADKERWQQNPAVAAALARKKARRRRRQLAALLVLLLLLLLRFDCDCAGAPPPVGPTVEVVAVEPPPPIPDKPPLKGKLKPKKRPPVEVKPPAPPSWLDQFRLQVAARSPTLSACFNGTEKPGAMRYSGLVHARTGKVSESEVEPVFRGVSLTESQHACLIQGLTAKRYVLDEPDPDAPARRVSLIFEF